MKNLFKLLLIFIIFCTCNISNNNKKNTIDNKERKNKENINKVIFNTFTDTRDGQIYKIV